MNKAKIMALIKIISVFIQLFFWIFALIMLFVEPVIGLVIIFIAAAVSFAIKALRTPFTIRIIHDDRHYHRKK